MELGSIGVWTFAFEGQPIGKVREAAAELEELGYGAIWFGEAFGREPLTQASLLLHATNRLTVATGIARTSLKDPLTMAMAHHTLTEAFPERFLLGLGGHRSPKQQPVPGMPGMADGDPRPVETMRNYLEAMDKAPLRGFAADAQPRRALAALGPRMLRLAAEQTWGAHPYFVPVEHTVQAREVLGPEPLLAVEQAVVLGHNRDVARAHVEGYLVAAHHNGNLRRLGFTDDDLAGSDRLVDAIVVTGDADAIAKRVQEHLDAGANHVCIQVLTEDSQRIPLAEWRELAGLIRRPAA